jgi:hypothetical protein
MIRWEWSMIFVISNLRSYHVSILF